MSTVQSFELTEIDKMNFYYNYMGDILVMGTSFLETTQPITQDHVKTALIYLQKRHPFLGAYLDAHFKENRFYIKFDQQDQKVSDQIELEWLDLCDEPFSMRKLIEESSQFVSRLFTLGPGYLLWRVQVISYKDEQGQKKYVLNLIAQQAITDGLNIITLSIEIANILNSILTDTVCEEMKTRMEPCESLYETCKKTRLYKEEFQPLIDKMNNEFHPKFLLHEKFKEGNESGLKLDFFKFDKEFTSKILAKSKQHKLRLTGFFQTAAFYALHKLYLENELTFPKSLKIEVPTSLRVRYKPKLDLAHCRFQTVWVEFPVDENKFGEFVDFWADAKYINDLIQENTSTETVIEKGTVFSASHSGLEQFCQVFADRWKNGPLEEAREILNHEITCDLVISNLGTFVNDAKKVLDGPIDIKEIYCTDSLNSKPRVVPAIYYHMLFWRGEIMAQYGCNMETFGRKYVERYKELYLNVINSLV